MHSYAADSGVMSYFDEYVMEGEHAEAVGNIEAFEEDMAREVNLDPNSIGFVGHAFQRGAKALHIVSTCGIESTPSPFSAKTEDYPFNRRVYAYHRADDVPEAIIGLLDYAISTDADGVIAKSGFIDLGVDRLTQASAEERMQEMLKSVNDPFELLAMRDLIVEMIDWDRLSTTFRFGTGSSRLDNKAQLDLERLVEYLEKQPEGTEVLTVGFTDSDGAFSGNQGLSERRAAEVLTTIQQFAGDRLGHIAFSSRGFGELSPSACNDSDNHKRINRRVEIWIRN